MTRHEWHSLAAFGVLVVALGLLDPKLGMYTVGIASAVVIVRNSDKISHYLGG